jgi:hypothetical protein
MEYNLVEFWLRRDPVRWLAGVLGGLFAGAVAIGLAMVLASINGYETWFPVKLMGTILLGPVATDTAPSQNAILAGLIVFEGVCVFWGFIFSHFVMATRIPSLLAMGLVWGIFSWIFTWNLFMQSFRQIFAAQIPSGLALPVCIAYGVSLVSVGIIDRLMKSFQSDRLN